MLSIPFWDVQENWYAIAILGQPHFQLLSMFI